MNSDLPQAICRPRYPGTLSELISLCRGEGIEGIDQLNPAEWGELRETGIVCSLTPSHDIQAGLCDKRNHAQCAEEIIRAVDATHSAGFPNVVCFSGVTAEDMDPTEAHRNCVSGLKLVAKFVEERRVTLCLEIVSERHFPGYYCNRTQRAVDICRELGSPAVKVLFDIYHVQNTEGSIIENLTSNLEYIGHVHTAGVPGRHELSDDQELNYRAIVSAIKAAGYRGFVGHELQPSGDADAAFSEAARICR